MLRRIFLFFILLIGFIDFGFSIISTSSCMIINEGVLDGDRKVVLTSSIINSGANPTCFELGTNNFEFDCQGNTVDGVDTNWRSAFAPSFASFFYNVTIRNCVISDWSYGIDLTSFSSNNLFTNLTFNSNLYGLNTNNFPQNNILENSTFESNYYSIYIYPYAKDNIFRNLVINNSGAIGIYLSNGPERNTFDNVSIYNSVNFEVYLSRTSTFETFVNNTFKNSYLGNWSKIGSNNWNNTPTYFYGNSYLVGTNLGGCFDPAFNLSCEGVLPPVLSLPIVSSSSSSNLPSLGSFSVVLSLGFISLFLFFI